MRPIGTCFRLRPIPIGTFTVRRSAVGLVGMDSCRILEAGNLYTIKCDFQIWLQHRTQMQRCNQTDLFRAFSAPAHAIH